MCLVTTKIITNSELSYGPVYYDGIAQYENIKNVFFQVYKYHISIYIPSLIIASLLLLKIIVNSTYMLQCTFP